MKKRCFAVLAVLLLFCTVGCKAPAKAQSDCPLSLQSSYVAAQSDKAFTMLQKSIFRSMLQGWAGQEYENPVWGYDTFTQYTLFDSGLKAQATELPLYCCGFTDDAGKAGFVVLAYDGDGLQKVELQATPYLYSLDTAWPPLAKALDAAGVSAQQAIATRGRVQQPGADTEIIVLSDGQNHCVFDLATPESE
ncbi:MAG: hypothetical protein PHG73_10995 [Pygmaiobacter sp.]|nr:hypothetical protein [Pygmaiobacter sp.]